MVAPAPVVVDSTPPVEAAVAQRISITKAKRPAPQLGRTIKNIINPQSTATEAVSETPVETNVAVAQSGFTEDSLVRCWDAFIDFAGEKVHLKNTMINSKPILLDKFVFEIVLHNPVQADELLKNSYEILNFLRYNLKNDRIEMRTRISEANEKKLAYTTYEKFDLLLSINPVLSKLKEMFDLRID